MLQEKDLRGEMGTPPVQPGLPSGVEVLGHQLVDTKGSPEDSLSSDVPEFWVRRFGFYLEPNRTIETVVESWWFITSKGKELTYDKRAWRLWQTLRELVEKTL